MEIEINGDKVEIWCKGCKKKIICDYDKWSEENPNEKWIQCLYCLRFIRLK